MENVHSFVAANGCAVIKVVPPSGVTGYADAAVPRDALLGLHKKLMASLKRPLAERRRKERQEQRRRVERVMRKRRRQAQIRLSCLHARHARFLLVHRAPVH
ncbi:hypothetical protein [Burkholderia sp. BCC1970]|uniref:hypothetical protein n=1 Tax=Burkholderia sp. BCC1970 TaxID=2817437 RepID=UPI002ABE8CB2|nr:hypothetical protein [Burkholderia sp. BCC1970]